MRAQIGEMKLTVVLVVVVLVVKGENRVNVCKYKGGSPCYPQTGLQRLTWLTKM